MRIVFLTFEGMAIFNCIKNIADCNLFDSYIVVIRKGNHSEISSIGNTIFFTCGFDNKLPDNEITRLQEYMYELDKTIGIDAYITCSGNYEVHHVFDDFQSVRKKQYMYMVDPYGFNQKNNEFVRMKEEHLCEELILIQDTRALFCTPIMKGEYKKEEKFCNVLQKIQSTDIPVLSKNLYDFVQTDCGSQISKKQIILLYAGVFYPIIRKPNHLFRILWRLPRQYRLLIAGNIAKRYQIIIKIFPQLNKKIFVLGEKDRKGLFELYKGADALINIGNCVENQLPSKLIEYFSTGKTIVNILNIDHCCTIAYTKKYPKAMDVFPGEKPKEAAKRIDQFINNVKNDHLEFDMIESLFKENMPENVAATIYNVVKNAMEERNQ